MSLLRLWLAGFGMTAGIPLDHGLTGTKPSRQPSAGRAARRIPASRRVCKSQYPTVEAKPSSHKQTIVAAFTSVFEDGRCLSYGRLVQAGSMRSRLDDTWTKWTLSGQKSARAKGLEGVFAAGKAAK